MCLPRSSVLKSCSSESRALLSGPPVRNAFACLSRTRRPQARPNNTPDSHDIRGSTECPRRVERRLPEVRLSRSNDFTSADEPSPLSYRLLKQILRRWDLHAPFIVPASQACKIRLSPKAGCRSVCSEELSHCIREVLCNATHGYAISAPTLLEILVTPAVKLFSLASRHTVI